MDSVSEDSCSNTINKLVLEVRELKTKNQRLEGDNQRLERENNELILRMRLLKESIYFKLMFVLLFINLMWLMYGVITKDNGMIVSGVLQSLYNIGLILLVINWEPTVPFRTLPC